MSHLCRADDLLCGNSIKTLRHVANESVFSGLESPKGCFLNHSFLVVTSICILVGGYTRSMGKEHQVKQHQSDHWSIGWWTNSGWPKCQCEDPKTKNWTSPYTSKHLLRFTPNLTRYDWMIWDVGIYPQHLPTPPSFHPKHPNTKA